MDEFTPARLQAALVVAAVLRGEGSLASLMTPAQQRVSPADRAFLQQLCFGVLRWQPRLQAILNRLLEKPLRERDQDVQALLLLGLFQLEFLRTPDHAAIDTAVDACRLLHKPWATKLVNAILRRYQREHDALAEALASSPAYKSAHPNWLRKAIERHWPEQASEVFVANNDHPPLTLRVNLAAQSRESYLQTLQTNSIEATQTPFSCSGITLQSPMDVQAVPGFSAGLVSVQDEAAQLAGELLQLQAGQRVLDACCAPGGKTGHIVELAATMPAPLAALIGLDLEPARLRKVEENLQRLRPALAMNTPLQLLAADARQLNQWWDGQPFDRILLDAPCSATGVLRRHPDIKILRKATDVAKLAALQLQLLRSLWATLRPGGRLVYATCSLLPEENNNVVAQFIDLLEDARHQPIVASWGLPQPYGRQLLPTRGGHDGFYYACLEKQAP